MFVPFAQAATTAQAPPPWVSLFPFVAMFGLFYFMLIRPQQKARRQQEAMLKALKKHDAVVTVGGLHGTILNVKDTTVVIRVDDDAKVEIDRSAVARVLTSTDA